VLESNAEEMATLRIEELEICGESSLL
jgi:hypothetical protein